MMILWVWFVSGEACTGGCVSLEGARMCRTLDCNVVDLVAYLMVNTNGSQCVTVTGSNPLGNMEECVVVGL